MTAGLNELRCIVRDTLGLYGTIAACATYTDSGASNSNLPVDDIVMALKQCVAEHPVLTTIVLDTQTDSPLLARQANMSISHHLRISSHPISPENAMAEVLNQVHNDPLDDLSTHPPWRLYIRMIKTSSALRTFIAAFAYSHAIADGFSGLLFHRSFLRALCGTEGLPHTTDANFVPETSSRLFPALEQAATLPISWSFLLGPLIAEYCPGILKRALGMSSNEPSEVWTGASSRPTKPTAAQPLHTSLRHRSVSNRTVERVSDACRLHQTKLTGLLILLTSRSLARSLQETGQEDPRLFKAETAIDLRRCIPAAKDTMGNFPSAVTDVVTTSNTKATDTPLTKEDWQTAQRLTHRLQEASSTLSDQPVGLLKYLSDFRSWTIKKASQPPECSFSVSNLGVFETETAKADGESESGGGWVIGDMAFSQSADATGAAFNLNLASTKAGGLNVVVTWWPGMLGVQDEGRLMERVCGGVVDQMEHIAG